MKTLRQEFNELESKIYNRFTELVNTGDYSFVESNIRAIYDEEADEVLQTIETDGFVASNRDYDILESFAQIYYNNRRGDEVMGYLLGAEKEAGIYVFNPETLNEEFIKFSDLNGLESKILVIEEIENS